jgi:cytoskeletal protein RodZ
LVRLTKIPRRSLERLEAGAFDDAPDGFARGFVRTVAEALGLDPAEAVMRLMNEPEEDESGFSGARLGCPPQLAMLGLATVGLLILVLLWTLLAGWLAAPPPAPSPEVVVREDPVRALAVEEAEREEYQPPGEAAPEQRVPPPQQVERGDRALAR